MKLTKEQRKAIEERLDATWGFAELRCDGHLVQLQVVRWKGMSYRVATYVDGVFQGAWVSGREAYPQQKFLRKSVRPLVSPAKRKQAEKVFGKRHVAKDPFYSATLTSYHPDWASGRAALAHLCKVCDSIEDVTGQNATAEATP